MRRLGLGLSRRGWGLRLVLGVWGLGLERGVGRGGGEREGGMRHLGGVRRLSRLGLHRGGDGDRGRSWSRVRLGLWDVLGLRLGLEVCLPLDLVLWHRCHFSVGLMLMVRKRGLGLHLGHRDVVLG